MYDVALTVRACLRAGTSVDVVWPVAARGLDVSADAALALTPGGGRVGSMFGGALDGQLIEAVSAGTSRLVDVELSQVDALVAGLPQGGVVSCLVMAAADLPAPLWDRLVARDPVTLVADLDDHRVTRTELAAPGDDDGATRVEDDRVVTVLRPVTKLVIAGGGPIAEAIARAAELLGWRVLVSDDVNEAVGQVTALSALDSLVVIGHDDRLTGAALEAALSGPVVYIGSVGPRRLQDSRADWLVRRGVEDLDRIHGPAGLDIGARTPAEIAVSVLAEALAVPSVDSMRETTAARRRLSMGDDAVEVLRALWAAEGQDDIDAICGPSKDCKNMSGVTFDGYAEPGSDLGSAWRDKLAREGKLRSEGESVRDLVLGRNHGD